MALWLEEAIPVRRGVSLVARIFEKILATLCTRLIGW
jgi:hypothetical protein